MTPTRIIKIYDATVITISVGEHRSALFADTPGPFYIVAVSDPRGRVDRLVYAEHDLRPAPRCHGCRQALTNEDDPEFGMISIGLTPACDCDK